MKKLCLMISVILCVTLMFTGITFADSPSDGILTLDEAKELALKNDVLFNLQDSYIEQAKENYDEVYSDNSKSVTSKGTLANKVAAEVSQDAAIENAAFSVRKAISKKDDLKITSDSDVTNTFYGVIKAKYALIEAEADINLKKNALETGRIKYGLNLITMDSLSQSETAYASAQAAYNKAFSDLQNSMLKLEKSIGVEMGSLKDQLDMTLNIPDIKSLDINKIKEDNLKNNSTYYSLSESYKTAKNKLLTTQARYDDYYDKLKNNSTLRDAFDNMLYDAQRSFDDAEYSYNQKISDMNDTFDNQYSSINDLFESYGDQKNQLEDKRLEIDNNKIRYQMGLLSKSALDTSLLSLTKLEDQLSTTIMNLNTQYLSLTQYSLN